MIDIHCHILPMFDDGASDLAESVAMARLAVSSGVTGIIATPHFQGDRQSLELMPKLLARYDRLSKIIVQQQIPLKFYPGAEILCTPETVSMARQRLLPTLSDSNYLLTEFFFNESAEFMSNTLFALAECGYRPVVAHPERYDAVQQSPELIEHWFFQGLVIQLNKGSLLGAFGPEVQETAQWILRSGLAHTIASDAHSIRRRTTDMMGLREYLQENCPPRYVQVLLEENPARIVTNQDMFPTI
jgi:protein-tyrosine phosphatase